jgi:hypothetical protein
MTRLLGIYDTRSTNRAVFIAYEEAVCPVRGTVGKRYTASGKAFGALAQTLPAVGETYSPFPEINALTLETRLSRLRTGNSSPETSSVFLGTAPSFLETKFLSLGISYPFLGTETPPLRTGYLFLGMRAAGVDRKACGEGASACLAAQQA